MMQELNPVDRQVIYQALDAFQQVLNWCYQIDDDDSRVPLDILDAAHKSINAATVRFQPEKIIMTQQPLNPQWAEESVQRSEIVVALVRHLYEQGILPSPEPNCEENEDFPFVLAAVRYIAFAKVESKADLFQSMNKQIWRLSWLLGTIAYQLQRVNADWATLHDANIEALVSSSATTTAFDDKEVLLSVASCLNYWIKGEAFRSISFRFSNLLEVVSHIATAINNIDEPFLQ
ncbi:hypothetical protein JOY44_26200 (plasmid) [Phormidium sp. CLA17]|nr:hypothetical protein [Leptolyngbya sp. Cla-17]